MKADAATEAAVRSVLDKVNDAHATRNMAALLATIAPQAQFSLPAADQAEGEAFPN